MIPVLASDRKTRIAIGFIVSASFLFAAYCHLSHLSGALGFASDENRAYHYQLLSPLLYFLSRPFTQLFQSLDAPYYLLGTAGLINIGLAGWLIRRTVSPTAGWVTVVLFCFYDYPLVYAKLLYYSTLHMFFMLASMVIFVEAHRLRSHVLYLITGALAGLIVLVNPSGMILGAIMLIYMSAYFWMVSPRPNFKHCASAALVMASGAVAVYAVFELFIVFWLKKYPFLDQMSFFTSCRIYGSETPAMYELGSGFVKTAFAQFWKKTFTFEEGGWYRLIWLTAASSAGCALAFFKSHRGSRPLAIFGAAGATLQILLAYYGVQPFLERTFLWLAVPVTGLSAYALHETWKYGGRLKRIVMLLTVMGFVFFGAQKCLAITRATFSVDPINRYLSNQGIDKENVATLLPIDRYKDYLYGHKTKPIIILTSTYLDAKRRHDPIIHWPAMYRMYRSGAVRYLLTSGISSPAPDIGKDDPLLIRSSPMMEWEHPSANRHVYGKVSADRKVRLYDLDNVLRSKEAVLYVLQMEKQIKSAVKGG